MCCFVAEYQQLCQLINLPFLILSKVRRGARRNFRASDRLRRRAPRPDASHFIYGPVTSPFFALCHSKAFFSRKPRAGLRNHMFFNVTCCSFRDLRIFDQKRPFTQHFSFHLQVLPSTFLLQSRASCKCVHAAQTRLSHWMFHCLV